MNTPEFVLDEDTEIHQLPPGDMFCAECGAPVEYKEFDANVTRVFQDRSVQSSDWPGLNHPCGHRALVEPPYDDLFDRVAGAIFRGTRTNGKIDEPWDKIKRHHPDVAETYQRAAIVVVEELNATKAAPTP